MYPYGDTRTDDYPPPVSDDGDHRAAVWTARAFYAALFIAVICGAIFVGLWSISDEEPAAKSVPAPVVETVTTLPAQTQVGPTPGTELAGYITTRKAALTANRDERLAVVSLAKYSTQAQVKTLLGANATVALLVAPAGTAPAVVTGDLAAWAKTQTATTQAERDEIKKLIPTVDDPAFKTFYNSEVARLDKALKAFDPASAIVYGAVVKAPAAALQALGAKAEVRLVDLADTATPTPEPVFRGLRPEETAKANEPPLRP
ncbi:MAG TPA: hypothetical protein VMZ73_06445 [Acidimicrobiales bacterium]|nr:hypothetical protein [Acidimicrobiales bacterium]